MNGIAELVSQALAAHAALRIHAVELLNANDNSQLLSFEALCLPFSEAVNKVSAWNEIGLTVAVCNTFGEKTSAEREALAEAVNLTAFSILAQQPASAQFEETVRHYIELQVAVWQIALHVTEESRKKNPS